MVEIRDLTFKYSGNDKPSLDKVNLQIHNGECVLICGESGCGKTTLTKALNGLIPHYYSDGERSGSVTCCGLDVGKTPLEVLSDHIGSVFQNPRSQFFCVDTTGELAFGCENKGMDPSAIKERMQTVISTMRIEDLMDRNIFALSGGEKQKIACASVSAMDPELYVLDEPTSNLDYDGIVMLTEVVDRWKKQGKTIMIAEHRLGWLRGIADRVILLQNGRIGKEYDGIDFYRKTAAELNALGLRAWKGARDFPEYPDGFYRKSPGENPAGNSEEGYTFSDFRYAYRKGRNLFDFKEMSIPRHSVVALIGSNGVGKSTFSRCLCGLMKGFKGKVSDGKRTYKGKNLIGLCYMVMQDVNHQLFTDSCLEEIMLGMENEDKDLALAVLSKMGLEEFADRHPMSLSGGQKQRIAICQAYLSDRDILLFDEPTSGLDFVHMKKTADMIKEIARDKTVFIITHDMELVDECCTHILKMGGNCGNR